MLRCDWGVLGSFGRRFPWAQADLGLDSWRGQSTGVAPILWVLLSALTWSTVVMRGLRGAQRGAFGRLSRPKGEDAKYLSLFLFFLLKIKSLLRYNSYAKEFTHLNCTVKIFINCTIIQLSNCIIELYNWITELYKCKPVTKVYYFPFIDKETEALRAKVT